jgi:hypothetical protein
MLRSYVNGSTASRRDCGVDAGDGTFGESLGGIYYQGGSSKLGLGPWAKTMPRKMVRSANFGFMARGGLSKNQESRL